MVTGCFICTFSVCVLYLACMHFVSFFLSVTLILLIFPCNSVGKSVHPYCLTATVFDFPRHVGQVSLLSDNNLYLSNLKGSEGKQVHTEVCQKERETGSGGRRLGGKHLLENMTREESANK